ncbi:hypothetical protein [Sutcliffiella rhizosphaerae]|uniref:DUF4129 domain-containing protein n=1 Tax=Sutcliffiella rhizosphaerae TaxID=2880967 RepID=A0ABM8YPX1_9BACI|nr:hypothetical protein [Sutcliffiella rhizosphaerae]CAG9621861.1 hypothetical protein BACCIP111883_02652 [Sutcliffiella rhizosphaerae]
MVSLWKNVIHLLLEMNIFYFFVLLFYLDSGTLPSLIGILLPLAISFAIFTYLSNMLPNTYASILIVAPVLAVFSYLASFSIGLSLLIGFFISIRSFMHIKEERPLSTFALLIISFIWMPFIYACGVLVQYPHGFVLMTLFGGQLLLIVLLYSGVTVIELRGNPSIQKKVISSSAILLGCIVVVSVTIATIGKWFISLVFSTVGQGISMVFNLLARPIFYLLGLHDWTPNGREMEETETLTDFEEDELEPAMFETVNIFDNSFIVAAMIILFVSILYFLLNKKKVTNKCNEHETQEHFVFTMTKMSNKLFSSDKKSKPPKNQVRKLMYDLEQLAIKKKRGRMRSETLEEWLKRETGLKKDFIQLYAKVRYGEIQLSDNEIEKCTEMAKEIRQVMKQWKKTG